MPANTEVFVNGTPPSWGVVITQIGCKFFYQDGNGQITREWYTYKNTHLSAGESDSINSDDPAACVQQVAVGVTVYVPNKPEQSFTQSVPGDAQHCQEGCTFTVGQQATPLAKSTKDFEKVLEMTSSSELPIGMISSSIKVAVA